MISYMWKLASGYSWNWSDSCTSPWLYMYNAYDTRTSPGTLNLCSVFNIPSTVYCNRPVYAGNNKSVVFINVLVWFILALICYFYHISLVSGRLFTASGRNGKTKKNVSVFKPGKHNVSDSEWISYTLNWRLILFL